MSNSSALNWIDDVLDKLEKDHLLRSLTIRESPHVAGKVQIGGKQLIDFGSNDYLGLSAEQKLVDAVKSNSGYVGWGSGASPLIHGRGTLHARLEQELARFENCESALTFTSGFAANVGAISSLVDSEDVIFSDQLNHASIIDGCRLSGADIQVYRHADANHLSELITQSEKQYRRRLIVTDGLFSMDGDLAPLPDLVDLAQEHEAMLLVDEAHATGVFGANGRGVSEHFGVHEKVDVIVGTLSKSLGCHGGFVAGTESLIRWLTNRARSYIFSTAVPDATCMAAVTSMHLVSQMKPERQRLLQSADKLRSQLVSQGIEVGRSQSQIIPIVVGDPDKAVEIRNRLEELGYFVPAIRPPAVPRNESRLRISLNTRHNDEMINGLADALTSLLCPS